MSEVQTGAPTTNKVRGRSLRVAGGEEIIKMVIKFKLLGRVVSEEDDETPAIEANLKKARIKWAM